MPEMTGWDVCQKLRTTEDLKHIPIFFMTQYYDSANDRIGGLDIGGIGRVIQGCRIKPPTDIIVRINTVKHLMRKLFKKRKQGYE